MACRCQPGRQTRQNATVAIRYTDSILDCGSGDIAESTNRSPLTEARRALLFPPRLLKAGGRFPVCFLRHRHQYRLTTEVSGWSVIESIFMKRILPGWTPLQSS